MARLCLRAIGFAWASAACAVACGPSESAGTGAGGAASGTAAASGSGGSGGHFEPGGCEDPMARVPASANLACVGQLDWATEPFGQALMFGSFTRLDAVEKALQNADPDPIPDKLSQPTYSSVQILDLNGDGRLDLLYNRPSLPRGSSMLLQAEDGTFQDAGSPFEAVNCLVQADLDGDGLNDLFCMAQTPNGLGQTLVWNEGAGPDFTSTTTLPNLFPMAGVAWDIDEDGLLDLVLSVFNQPNRVLRNRGDRTFEDVAGSFGLDDPGAAWSTAFLDFDGDGRLDPYVMNDGSFEGKSNTALRALGPNESGDPTFAPLSPMQEGCDTVGYFGEGSATPMGLGLGDIDSSGTLEAYVAMTTNSPLFSRDQSGKWRDFRPALGLEEPRTSTKSDLVRWDTLFWDVDHDGLLDLLIAGGDDIGHAMMPDRGESSCVFYHGAPCNRFDLMTEAAGLGASGHFLGFSRADLDGDGDLDLIVSGFNQAPYVYRNDVEPSGQHLLLSLRGTASNPHGLGAQLLATAGGRSRAYQMGDHFAPQGFSPPLLDIGLGEASALAELRVVWPSGYVQVVRDLPAGKAHVIDEPPLLTIEPKSRHVAAGGAGVVVVTVRPFDEEGKPMTGAEVSIDAPFQPVTWLTDVVQNPDGSASRSLAASGSKGSAVIEAKVGGVAIKTRPRVYFD